MRKKKGNHRFSIMHALPVFRRYLSPPTRALFPNNETWKNQRSYRSSERERDIWPRDGKNIAIASNNNISTGEKV